VLYAIGKNEWNQLGIANDDHHCRNIYHRVQIHFFDRRRIKLKKIACALTYSIFLDENGVLYACGRAKDGGLGLGDVLWSSTVQRVTLIQTQTSEKPTTSMIDIVCGEHHCLALSNEKRLFSWGSNRWGQLGHGRQGPKTAEYRPKIVKYVRHMQVEKIDCGSNHSVILSIGKVYCFGCNLNCECGNGRTKSVCLPELNKTLSEYFVTDIKCGFQHNVAKTQTDCFYLWGMNDFNQCLHESPSQSSVVKVPTKYSGHVHSDQLEHVIIDMYPGWKETRIVTAKTRRVSYL